MTFNLIRILPYLSVICPWVLAASREFQAMPRHSEEIRTAGMVSWGLGLETTTLNPNPNSFVLLDTHTW